MVDAWKAFFGERHSVFRIVFTFALVIIVVYSLSRFIVFVESRQGAVIEDPFLILFDAVELNVLIFALIYLSIIAALISLLSYPARLLVALQSYSLLVLVRILMMYVTPLNPPGGTIDLNDPLVFIVGTGTKVTKDLFFSGHTSTLFLLFLVSVSKKIKYVFLINTVFVGTAVVLQKAHYTIDVLVAPFVAYGCYRLILMLNKKLKYIDNEK